MTIYSIRDVRLPSGERIPPLVSGGPLGLPAPLAARFILTEYRPSGKKISTMRQRLRALALTYNFMEEHGIDIAERVAKRIFLSREEICPSRLYAQLW